MTDGELSPEEYEHWITPKSALERLSAIWNEATSRAELYSRLQHALVLSAAKHCTIKRTGAADRPHQFVLIESAIWESQEWVPVDHFWNTGSIQITHRGQQRTYEYSFFEVRFDPAQIQSLIEAQNSASGATTNPKVSKPRAGARRKDWWDHLWIEMIRRIQAGTLKPKNQAELQGLLEDFVGNELGENYGDSTLKPMASNLFKFLNENGGK